MVHVIDFYTSTGLCCMPTQSNSFHFGSMRLLETHILLAGKFSIVVHPSIVYCL